jgi:antitoxin VapB
MILKILKFRCNMLELATQKPMTTAFHTRQFMAGNSPAVRIPVNMAFPNQTKLVVKREGDRIIVEPQEKSLGDLPKLLRELDPYFVGGRPAFEETERDWS